jgi:hypothetical protein
VGCVPRDRLQSLPIDQAPTDPATALQAMTPIITSAWNAMNVDAVELAMQGPLAGYFQGLSYDAANDTFSPTTDQQLAPMYEAIFEAAPSDPVAAASWLTQWKPIVDVVLSNLDRGQDLAVSYAYVFASMVHAYETVGYPLDIVATATALGVPSDTVIACGSTLTGNGSPDIFYLNAGNQTVNASAGDDNFVMGQNFGDDVINAVQGGTSIANALAPLRARDANGRLAAGRGHRGRGAGFGRLDRVHVEAEAPRRRYPQTGMRKEPAKSLNYNKLNQSLRIPQTAHSRRHSITICKSTATLPSMFAV